MRDAANDRPRPRRAGGSPGLSTCLGLGLALTLLAGLPAQAGKLAWLDEVVQEVVREAEVSGKLAARAGSDGATTATRSTAKLFAREADEGLEVLARRSDELARAGRRGVEATSEAVLRKRFLRLVPRDGDSARVFAALAPAEKRLVVEMGETAQQLARRYPGQAEEMIRALGTEGMSAVRVFGDDVAEVLAREGNGAVGVLRKTGRGGWAFFNQHVLPNKKKLVAAGVLTAFLADPDKFVDYAGEATEFAAREFARAGVQLAGAVAGGAARGLETTVAQVLDAHGLNFAIARYVGMVLAGGVAVAAALVVLGFPARWMLKPFTWPIRLLLRSRSALKARSA